MTCAALVWSIQLSGPTSRIQKRGWSSTSWDTIESWSVLSSKDHPRAKWQWLRHSRYAHLGQALHFRLTNLAKKKRSKPLHFNKARFSIPATQGAFLSLLSPRTHRSFARFFTREPQTNNEEANHFSVLLVDCGCLHSHECKDDLEGGERIVGFPFSFIPKIVFTFWFVLSNVLPLVWLAGQQRSRSLIPSSSFGRYCSRIDGTWRWWRFCCWGWFFY